MRAGVLAAALVLPALASPAAAQAQRSFRGWIVGCDNTCSCRSLAAAADLGPSERPQLVVDRIGPYVAVRLLVPTGQRPGPVVLAVDGRCWTATSGADNPAIWTGAPALALACALVNGRGATVEAAGWSGPGPSLSGAAAALLWMDEAQQQIGTVAGFARAGARAAAPAHYAPAVRPWRGLRTAPAPVTLPAAVRRTRGIAAADCVVGARNPMDEAHALDAVHTLVLIECGSGAYNRNLTPFVVRRGEAAGARPVPGLPDTLTNAGWDAGAGVLEQFNKGRGLADCGIIERRVWTGAAFTRIGREAMHECRGVAPDWWMSEWRAELRH